MAYSVFTVQSNEPEPVDPCGTPPFVPRIKNLPNNIYLITTTEGDILVNSPPETLKFLLAEGLKTPRYVLLPPDIPVGKHLGSSGFIHKGINYACVEFLLYANFFLEKGSRTRLITTTQNQAVRLRRILHETLTGPTDAADYLHDRWLKQECEAVGFYPPLGRAPTVDDLAEVVSIDTGGGEIGRVSIEWEGETYRFYEDGALIAQVPTTLAETPFPLMLAPPQPVQRQELTLQFIGGSDGFDPGGITTCFLAYFGSNQQTTATLFDTAAYLRLRLGNLGVSTRQISEVVVTHLHEDHLAGFPELLLMGEARLRVITSETIYISLLRVLSAQFNVPEDEVAALFDFYPLRPGRPLVLDGKQFEAIYAVHSIPTLAVKVDGLYYSGDMRYDESLFADLESRGILSSARREELTHFADDTTVLVQDAGGGTVHTSITPEVLRTLAAKSKILVLTHMNVSKHFLPLDEGELSANVEFARSGLVMALGETIPKHERADWLETISACNLYARLQILDRVDLAEKVTLCTWEAGEVIMEENSPSDMNTYIVHAGLVEILVGGKRVQVMGRGTSIGERGALKGDPRSAAVVAQSPVKLLKLTPEVFQPLAKILGLADAVARAEWLWHHPAFRHLPWGTLLDLALDFQPRHLQIGECLFEFGKPGHECYLLVSGKVMLIDENMDLIGFLTEPGEFFGGRAVLFGTPRNAAACVSQYSEIWALPARALHRLGMVYPNMLLHLRTMEARRLGKGPVISSF